MQHHVQWVGSAVAWDPKTDSFGVEVAFAVEHPALAGALDAKLMGWLRRELDDQRDVFATVPAPRSREGGIPFTTIFVSGLREPLPSRDDLIAAIDGCIAEVMPRVHQQVAVAEEYAASLQVSRASR